VQTGQLSGAMTDAEAKRAELEEHRRRHREEEARRREEEARKQKEEERKQLEHFKRLGERAAAEQAAKGAPLRQPRTEVMPGSDLRLILNSGMSLFGWCRHQTVIE